MAEWPDLNRLVWLHLPCCSYEHPSRVEDTVGDDVVVGAPVSPHTVPVAPVAADVVFNVGWSIGRGAIDQPVTLVDHEETPLLLWRLHRAGPPIETQRRNFVRLDVSFDVAMYLLESGPPTIARTIDISEGGLRMHVDSWAIDPGGRSFTVELQLEDKPYYIRSQVAWWGTTDDTGKRAVGIKFLDLDARVADEIRAFIFSTQSQRRRQETK